MPWQPRRPPCRGCGSRTLPLLLAGSWPSLGPWEQTGRDTRPGRGRSGDRSRARAAGGRGDPLGCLLGCGELDPDLEQELVTQAGTEEIPIGYLGELLLRRAQQPLKRGWGVQSSPSHPQSGPCLGQGGGRERPMLELRPPWHHVCVWVCPQDMAWQSSLLLAMPNSLPRSVGVGSSCTAAGAGLCLCPCEVPTGPFLQPGLRPLVAALPLSRVPGPWRFGVTCKPEQGTPAQYPHQSPAERSSPRRPRHPPLAHPPDPKSQHGHSRSALAGSGLRDIPARLCPQAVAHGRGNAAAGDRPRGPAWLLPVAGCSIACQKCAPGGLI